MFSSIRAVMLVALSLLVSAPTPAGATGHEVGGKSVSEAFPDPRLAALADSACHGDVGAVERQVRDGVDPNGVGLDGAVPLFWAITCESMRGIEALLKLGANPNYKVPDRYTLIYQASSYRNSDILRMLLKYGGDPNKYEDRANSSGSSIAWQAILLGSRGGRWDNYYLLLNAGLDINRPNELGHTVATDLLAVGQADKVVELLGRGYSYDLEDLGGWLSNTGPSTKKDNVSRRELQTLLEQRGVKFPVPPRMERQREKLLETAR